MWILIAACIAPSEVEGEPCERTEASTDERAPPVSEEEVLASLESYEPTEVVWSEAANDETSSSFSLVLTRAAGDATTVEYVDPQSPDCPEGVALHVPVEFEIEVSGGSVVATVLGAVDAYGASFQEFYFSDAAGAGTLDPVWAAEAEDDEGVRGEVTGWRVGLVQGFDAPEFHISADWEGADDVGVSVLWRGTVSVP